MASGPEALVAAGFEALEAGRWNDAAAAFAGALEAGAEAEALYGDGLTRWWLGDMHGSVERQEEAYASFRRRPDHASAAGVALRIAFHYAGHLANDAAAAGWLARGERLVDEHAVEELRGELLFTKAFLAADPVAGEALAREALERGRANGDHDLELCSLAQLGVALVAQGRVAEGVACLDEAMAASLAGEGNLETVAFTSCTMMTTCARCAEFERAAQWVRAADRFVARFGAPFIQAECRTVYGDVLVATGHWERADTELGEAVRLARDVPSLYVRAAACLAELRLAQGRLEEAEALVAGLDGHPAALPALARIQLRRGRPALAALAVQRRLDADPAGELERSTLLELLGEAELAGGEERAAAGHGRRLVESGRGLGCAVIAARGERLLGRALLRGDAANARLHLDAALAEFLRLGMPYEAARTRLALAEGLATAERQAAQAEARAALDAFEGLGAGRDVDAAAALLRRLGVPAARAGPRGLETLTKREREVLDLLAEGLSNPEIAARLFLSRKTVEHHVARVLAKLGLRNRAEAAAHAARLPATGPAAE